MKTNGFYSIVQYQPDPSRLEAVNIGLLLYCEESRKVELRLSHHTRRVVQLFGNHDLRFLQKAKRALSENIYRESFSTHAELSQFMGRLSNAIQLTPLRSIKVGNLTEDMEALFVRLVDERIERRTRIQRVLTEKLETAGVTDYLQKTVEVELDRFDQPLRVPFAYRNGRMNLISPVDFASDSKDVLTKVAEKALQSDLLKVSASTGLENHLVVVAQIPDGLSASAKEFIQETLEKHGVGLYDINQLEPLIQDIRHARELHP